MILFPGHDLDDVLEDEPAFLIRASDAEGPAVIRKAAFLYRARHRAGEYAAALEEWADVMEGWQHEPGNAAPPPPADEVPPVVEADAGQADDVDEVPPPAPPGPDTPTRTERRR